MENLVSFYEDVLALADFKAVQGLRPIPQHLLAFDVSLAELF